jgi:hypothetical protein
MTDLQLAIFDAFWHHTLSHGVAWFTTVVRGEGGSDTPVELTARIAGGYEATMANGRWRVTAQAECDQVTQYTEPEVTIIDTATLRYLVDTTTTFPADPVKATIPGPASDVPKKTGSEPVTSTADVVFGKRGFSTPSPATLIHENFGTVRDDDNINDFTIAIVFAYGPYEVGITMTDRGAFGICGTPGLFTGVAWDHYSYPHYAEHYRLVVYGQNIYTSLAASDGSTTVRKSKIAIYRRKSGATVLKINGIDTACSQETALFKSKNMTIIIGALSYGYSGRLYVRDYAFWDSALSDTDFDTLNTQLCTEYGVT